MGSSSFYDDPTDYQVIDASTAGSSFYGEGPGYAQVDPDGIKHLKDLAEAAAVSAEASNVSAAAHDASSALHDASATAHDISAAAHDASSAIHDTNSAASASAAATSEGNAYVSASNAHASDVSAASHDASATTQAGIATTKAAQASTSETNAATSATNSHASEVNAGVSEVNAAASAATATTQAGIATSQAGVSTTQAGISTTQAGIATTKASQASTSEANAAISASNANASDSSAASHASSAAASATTASVASAAAVAKLLEFNGVYYGALTADPSLDPNGDPPGAGDFYYNTALSPPRFRDYTGTVWQDMVGGSGGVTDADYLVKTAHSGLSAERVVTDTATVTWDWSSSGQAKANVQGLAAVATSGSYADLSGKPSLATVATSGAYSDLSGKPTLAPVASTGAYSDLSGKPSLATIATTGSASDLASGSVAVARLNLLPVTKEYTSTAGTISKAGLISWTHGLGAKPKIIMPYMVCTIADAGYSVGDEILMASASFGQDTIGSGKQMQIYYDATTINIRFGDASSGNTTNPIFICHKSTGSATAATHANWGVYVRAYA